MTLRPKSQSFMTHGMNLILMAYLTVLTLTKQWNLSHMVTKVNLRGLGLIYHNILLMLFPLLRNTQTLMK